MNRSAQLQRRKGLCPLGKGYPSEEAARTSGAGQREGATVLQCRNRACGEWHVLNAPAQPEEPAKRAEPARRVPLRPVSKKRAAANRVRKAVIKALYPDPLACSVPWCPKWADDVHEPLTRARGGSITDPENMKPLCRQHNEDLALRPESELGWAYDLGILRHSWDAAGEGGEAA